jgi:hypothetical protein
MLSTRATSLATLLAIAGLGAVAAPAHAVTSGASITIDSKTGSIFEGVDLSGTCPAGSGTAVVTVKQGVDVVSGTTADVIGGEWSTNAELWNAEPGQATATVNCLSYSDESPLGQATSAPFTIDELEFPGAEIEVGVSPQRVPVGGTASVSATCPEGSNLAAVLAGNTEADDPFYFEEVVPGSGGRVSARVPVTGDGEVEPEPGPAVAVVLCGDDSASLPQLRSARAGAARLLAAEEPITAAALEDMLPTAFGVAEFTILPAAVEPSLPTGPTTRPGTVTVPARSAVPSSTNRVPAATADRLAHTGSDPAPLAAIGVVLVALGAAAVRRARRA